MLLQEAQLLMGSQSRTSICPVLAVSTKSLSTGPSKVAVWTHFVGKSTDGSSRHFLQIQLWWSIFPHVVIAPHMCKSDFLTCLPFNKKNKSEATLFEFTDMRIVVYLSALLLSWSRSCVSMRMFLSLNVCSYISAMSSSCWNSASKKQTHQSKYSTWHWQSACLCNSYFCNGVRSNSTSLWLSLLWLVAYIKPTSPCTF